MKIYEGVDVQSDMFFTSILIGVKWPDSHPSHFTPVKEPLVPTG
jgi:hypothetical protein